MGLLRDIQRIFGKEKRQARSVERIESSPPAPKRYVPPPTPTSQPERAPEENRRRIEPALLAASGEEGAAAPNAIRIKAQPTRSDMECKFMVSRQLFEKHSWFFADRAGAGGWPLAEAVFAADEDVESLLLLGSTVTLTRKDKRNRDWKPLAEKIGAAIRAHLEAGRPVVNEEIASRIPPEEEFRAKIQQVIEAEINPGLAGHGGNVRLTGVEGNTIRLEMGGGCQGCASAAMTVKMGIEKAFRERVPYLGAVLDDTDHAAGENPYFR